MRQAGGATARWIDGDETAGEYVATEVPVAALADRVGAVRAGLLGRRFEAAADVVVCEGSRLVGLVPIEVLLGADPDVPLSDVMDADPPAVAPGDDREVAAWKSVRHGEGSLAVVDEHGAFVGLIPPARLLGILLSEHEQDAARLGGYLHDTAAARLASEERVVRRLWHRLPWLLLGLLGAIAASEFVGAFESDLERNVVLAFFLPSIVYLADAVGTQTETLMVRGLSVGVTVRHVIRREVITGVLIGVVLAGAFFPFAAWRWGDTSVATTVSLALLLACSTATAVAMALPWLLHRLGSDPAFASGPLGTVIQDLLSIVVYLLLARALVG